jgi:hypothetical protein
VEVIKKKNSLANFESESMTKQIVLRVKSAPVFSNFKDTISKVKILTDEGAGQRTFRSPSQRASQIASRRTGQGAF